MLNSRISVRAEPDGDRLIIFPEGEITSANAEQFEEELNRILAAYPGRSYLIDAENLRYVSSAGLRELMTLGRNTNEKVELINASPEVYNILDVTGFTHVFQVSRKARRISVEGCPVIGEGALGTVYRLDADKIVKVYHSSASLADIRREQAKSKLAFFRGIPTAISYDIVKVGDSYGSVFEMLHAQVLNDALAEQPQREDELLSGYLRLLRQVHGVELAPDELPQARDMYLQYLSELKNVLPGDTAERLKKLLSAMPDDFHLIHGDIQMKNVMLDQNGEPILIDMETLCAGNPVFELGPLFVAYEAYLEDEPDNSVWFMGISPQTCDRLWTKIREGYLSGRTPAEAEAARLRIRLVGYLRFLYLVAVKDQTSPELREVRIAHAAEHLRELAWQTEDLLL